MGTVLAVCVSREKGTQKENIGTAVFLEDWGIQGDAHAGKWHRQVSLLSHEKIEAFRARGAEVADGAFGENLVVAGIDFRSLPLGTRFQCNDVVLKLTQIGKSGHGRVHHAPGGRIRSSTAWRYDFRGRHAAHTAG